MTQSELYHTLALMQVEGVGDVIAKKTHSTLRKRYRSLRFKKIPTSKN
jgi:hypothetical protein